jgi:threonylcarbamoyladenosine tRNA methylthiotransferase MtaB
MPSLAVRNFGCRANRAEAFGWAEALRGKGLRLGEDWARSDVVVVNSCTLTGRADRDVRKFIRTVARANPAARIVVTGCYAERAPGEVAAMPNVVAVLPQSVKDGLPDRLAELAGRPSLPADRGTAGTRAAAEAGADEPCRARAYLKIQDGCDDRCAFCVIPGVRGGSRSVPAAAVTAAVRDLAGRGYREIVLAGIHLSSYGEDLEPRGSLLGLLREIEGAAGGARLRLSSLDPRRTGDALVSYVAASQRICPHFHLSLQHASERVLRLMGRAGGADRHRLILGELRRLAPDAALGADVIVGFPGETETDFEELRGFLEESPLTRFHVFPYSPRPGTPAGSRPRLAESVVTERAKTLRRLAAAKDLRFRRRLAGRELEAVVIGKTDRGAEVLTGNAVRVFVPSCRAPRRELVRVKMGRALPGRTEGEVVA